MKKLFFLVFLMILGICIYRGNIYKFNELEEFQIMNIEALTSDKEVETNPYRDCLTGTVSNATIHQTVPALYCGDCTYSRVLVKANGKCRLYK